MTLRCTVQYSTTTTVSHFLAMPTMGVLGALRAWNVVFCCFRGDGSASIDAILVGERAGERLLWM